MNKVNKKISNIIIMIVFNDCNRKGKALILIAGFLKRDCLVTFTKISLVFLLHPLLLLLLS